MPCLECEKKRREQDRDFDPRYDRPMPPPRKPDFPPRPPKEYFGNYTKLEKEIVAENLGLDHAKIINYADGEDIVSTIENGVKVLKLADKQYNPEKQTGYGRKILRKNPCYRGDKKVNILDQSQFESEVGDPLDNTIFIIQYDFSLDGKNITLPEHAVLWFIGGSLSNGSIVVNDASIYNSFLNWREAFSSDIVFYGTFAPGTTRFLNNCKSNTLEYYNGNDWQVLGTTSTSSPVLRNGLILYYGSSNSDSISGLDVTGNITTRTTTKNPDGSTTVTETTGQSGQFFKVVWDRNVNPEQSPLVRFNGTELQYRYWLIPSSIDNGQISFYSDGSKDTGWGDPSQENLYINGIPYEVYRHEDKQTSFDSQIKYINVDIQN